MWLRLRPSIIWKIVLLCIGLQAVYVLSGLSPLGDGGLFGPDSFMRVNRVLHLLGNGAYYSSHFPYSNMPFGEFLHWTRAFDILLVVGAGLAAPFTALKSAVFWWGAMISPLFQVATLLAFLWGMRPIFDAKSQFILGLLFLFQPAVLVNFIAGRVDHHSLVLFLFVLSMGFTVRMLIRPYRASVCIGAGVIAALAMWVSVESMAMIFLNLLALGLFWIIKREDFAKKSLIVSLSSLVGVAIVLVLERPFGQMLAVEFDRISIVSLTLLFLVAALWAGLYMVERCATAWGNTSARLLFASVGVLIAGLALWLVFPRFYLGPMVDMHPDIKPIWFDYVLEAKPIFSMDNFSFSRVIFWVGMVLPTAPFVIWLAVRDNQPERRRVMIYLCIGALFFIPIALMQLRAAAYPVLILLPVFAIILVRLLAWIETAVAGSWQALTTTLAVMGFMAGLPISSSVFASIGEPVHRKVDCALPSIARHLADPNGLGKRQTTILAAIDFGPELLYRTPHRVIATPYHRNSDGILGAYRIMTAIDPVEVRARLRARGVGLILLCPGSNHEVNFAQPRNADTFYRRLLNGRAPDWLSEKPLSPMLRTRFKLFEVTG